MNKKAKLILEIVVILSILGIVMFAFRYLNIMELPNTPVFEPEKEQPKLKVMDLNSTSRPIAVMINNLGTARKYHSGLQDAYLVYEMIVEGGITRLMAVFKDAETAKIGSIRSARPYYLDYALENDALFVHWGYSEQAFTDIRLLGISNIDGYSYERSYFFRDKSLPVASEHTGFTSMELIRKGITDLKYRNTSTAKPLLDYSLESVDYSALDGVLPATNIDIKYSGSLTTGYVYDEELKVYKRSVNNSPHVDYVSKNQYTAKNIITYQVRNTTIAGDVKGRQTLSNIGKGEGYYISEGKAVPITWEKKSREAKTIYRLANGEELKVNDGNTFIQIQPVGQSLTIT